MTNQELFFQSLKRNLEINMAINPHLFKHDFDKTFENYKNNILRGKFHTISKTIRDTCAEFRIKNTIKQIQEFIK